ncbi:hypothetical protein [Aureivirga sp. CE67]|nr:hypothetical protein [Aureivirga sp. CE67]
MNKNVNRISKFSVLAKILLEFDSPALDNRAMCFTISNVYKLEPENSIVS